MAKIDVAHHQRPPNTSPEGGSKGAPLRWSQPPDTVGPPHPGCSKKVASCVCSEPWPSALVGTLLALLWTCIAYAADLITGMDAALRRVLLIRFLSVPAGSSVPYR